MLNGDLYDASDPELVSLRINTRLLLKKLNESGADQRELRAKILQQLIPNAGSKLWIETPFYCDYGFNITVGDQVFFNFNCVVLDVVNVNIGKNVLIGPGVHIYTAMHPMNWDERAQGLEFGQPVTIGSDVWIGGAVIICPAVSIGNRSVIGAGSVVTKNIPDDVFAAGNPCRVKRELV